MSIFDVEHQPRAHRMIQRSLASQRMPHAYIFAGPEGVGREMLASRLAQICLCESPVQRAVAEQGEACAGGGADAATEGQGLDACGQCQDCQLVQAGNHPDLFLIYRQLNRLHPNATIRKQKALFLGVDVIRHFVVDRIGVRPSCGRAKVFIIREAERLNDAAQNSLLKTLEEPPSDTFLILITAALDRLLPTTRSRCQLVFFQSLPADYITRRMRAFRPEADEGEIQYTARRSGGSLGLALRQLDDGVPTLKGKWGENLKVMLAAGSGVAPHSLARPFIEDAKILGKLATDRDPDMSDTDASRVGLQTLLGVLGDFYMDAERQAVGATMPPINADQRDVVGHLKAGRSVEALAADVRKIQQADANLSRNANAELAIESLFIALAGSTG